MSNEWTQDQKERARFYGTAKRQYNYTAEQAKEILGIEHLADFKGPMGEALTALHNHHKGNPQSSHQAQKQQPAETALTVRNDLPTIKGELAQFYPDMGIIEAIAERARLTCSWANPNMKNALNIFEIAATVHYGYLIGALPNQIWGMKIQGKLVITEHYRWLLDQAKERDPTLDFWFEDVPADHPDMPDKNESGISPHIAVFLYSQNQSQKDQQTALLQTGKVDYEQSKAQCSTRFMGIFFIDELEKKDPPKTWTLRDVARKRATRKMVTGRYGVASSIQNQQKRAELMNIIQTDPETGETIISIAALESLVASAIDHERETESTRKALPPDEQLTRGRSILRGDDEDWDAIPATSRETAEADEEPHATEEPDHADSEEPHAGDTEEDAIDALFVDPAQVIENLRDQAGWTRKGETWHRERDDQAEPPTSQALEILEDKIEILLLGTDLTQEEGILITENFLLVIYETRWDRLTAKETEALIEFTDKASQALFLTIARMDSETE